MTPDSERWYWNPENIVRVQEFFGPEWEIPFRVVTLLADSTVVLLLAAVVLWTHGKRIAYTALAAAMLGAFVSSVLKFGMDVPRPEHIDMIAYETRTAPAFPSGHAMHAVAFWGTLAYFGIVRIPVVIAIAIAVMVSRIYLGIHYPADVIAGAGVGLLGILIGYLVWTRIFRRLSDQRISQLISVIFLGSVIIIPVAGAFPLGWEILGGLLGAGAGTLIEYRRIGYEPSDAAWPATLTRIAVGGAGVLVFLLLGLLARDMGSPPLLRSALMFPLGVWVTLAAPWLLSRIETSGGQEPHRRRQADQPPLP